MKKVRMIVEMDEELYKAFAEQDIFICGMRTGKTLLSEIWKAVKNATPLTECDDCVSREETIMCLTGINLPTDIDKLIDLYNERIKRDKHQYQKFEAESSIIQQREYLKMADEVEKSTKNIKVIRFPNDNEEIFEENIKKYFSTYMK